MEIVNFLLSKNADSNICVPKHNTTPVHTAFQYGTNSNSLLTKTGSTSILESLLGHNANVNALDSQKCHGLHYAAMHGKFEPIQWFYKKFPTASLNIQNDNGWVSCVIHIHNMIQTPLHYAVSHHQKKTVDVLLSLGCSKSLADKQGQTPLDIARMREYDDIVALLT